MSYLKDREIWLSNVPTGNPPAGYFWKFIQNGKVVVRDSSGNNQMMIATSGSQDVSGGPFGRTYSVNGSGALRLAMGGGTYTVRYQALLTS